MAYEEINQLYADYKKSLPWHERAWIYLGTKLGGILFARRYRAIHARLPESVRKKFQPHQIDFADKHTIYYR